MNNENVYTVEEMYYENQKLLCFCVVIRDKKGNLKSCGDGYANRFHPERIKKELEKLEETK